jgi:hypothetical protein
LLAYRELDDALGLTDLGGAVLSECRRGKNARHLLTSLFRQSVFGRLAGYEDVNDADGLAHDPAMRAVVDRAGLVRQAPPSLANQAVNRKGASAFAFVERFSGRLGIIGQPARARVGVIARLPLRNGQIAGALDPQANSFTVTAINPISIKWHNNTNGGEGTVIASNASI